MSDEYITLNNDDSRLTYFRRVIYNHDSKIDMSEYGNLVDFNFGEKFLYGRVNKRFMPMYLEEFSPARLVSLTDAQTDTNQQAINFVADAFKDLQNLFRKNVSKGKLSPDDPYLSDLKVYKSFANPIDEFVGHQASYTSAIETHFLQNEIRVKDFNEFLFHLKPLLMKSVKRQPFTFSGFLKSLYCPINVSGLVIEIADLDYFDDNKKMEFFFRNENWEFYLNACRSFGFMVDRNIPWRLVADIGSTYMLEYAAPYRLEKTHRILNYAYTRSDLIYYNKFRRYLLKLYDLVRLPQFQEIEDCNGSLMRKTVITKTYSEKESKKIFSDKDLLTLMFEIRFQEEPKVFEESEKTQILKDCLSLFDISGPSRASMAFERIINHPFDYRGSLSYNIKRRDQGYGEKIVLSKSR